LAGADQTFIITPENGYTVDQILVDDNPVTQNPYTFTNVQSDHTISANFKQNLPAIVPLCPAGTPFDNSKYAQNTPQSDPMIFTCNWDGNGRVYISGDASSLTGVIADDGFTIQVQPSGMTFDAPEHWAHQHPVVELTSGMTPGSNNFTLIVQNWQLLSMSYGSIYGSIQQTPYIIEVNSPTMAAAAEKISTDDMPAFISRTEHGIMVNGSIIT
jgi:hypothetical protein